MNPHKRLCGGAALFIVGAALGAGGGGGCTPDIETEPAPEALEFDTESLPPRVPQPTSLIINRQTGLIDFSLAGVTIPADCADPPPELSEAECAFDQYLQGLNGFPTVTPAQTPATAPLDPTTLTVGSNVVVVDSRTGTVVTDVVVGFDTTTRHLTVRPARSWRVGGSYWVGVRGYANGVRAANGKQVVGSPTIALLKQTDSLTRGVMNPSDLDPNLPALKLLAQSAHTPAEQEVAARSLVQLELIRLAYEPGWRLMNDVGGLPREETAVLWNFVIHTASVAELDPTVGLTPRLTAPNEVRVAVQGAVDPATVSPFIFAVQYGTVVLMDLTAAQQGNAPASFPRIDARVEAPDIVITSQAPFIADHQYGLFFTRGIQDSSGRALVPSPISVLLRLRAPLVDAAGKSTISTIADANAALLEEGRGQLSALFDDPSFAASTKIMREDLAYCFAAAFSAPAGGAP